jgi:hypothetical protein
VCPLLARVCLQPLRSMSEEGLEFQAGMGRGAFDHVGEPGRGRSSFRDARRIIVASRATVPVALCRLDKRPDLVGSDVLASLQLAINNGFDHNTRICLEGPVDNGADRQRTRRARAHARIVLDAAMLFRLPSPYTITFGSCLRTRLVDFAEKIDFNTSSTHICEESLMNVWILHASECIGNMGGVIVSALNKGYSSGLHAVLWKWRVSKLRKSLRDTFWIPFSFASETLT